MEKIDVPQRPEDLETLDLDRHLIIDLATKILAVSGTMVPSRISEEIKLSRTVVNEIVQVLIGQLLVESQGLEAGGLKSEVRYSLTDSGLKRAQEALSKSAYVGSAPIPISDLVRQIKRQSISRETIRMDKLKAAFAHLVLNDQILSQVGPAANSGRSMMLYGDPGNGKTSIAEALSHCFEDVVYIPRSIIVGGQIIKFFDETVHNPVELPLEESVVIDQRWVPCQRPVIVAGGELRLEDLDLKFDPLSRFYEAPMHTKALGGVFVLDDFGRQRDAPQEFLNRWIVPLEKRVDFFSLHTGTKFSLPHDQLVIFSTNRLPEEVGDGAALRRIHFKIFIPSPTKDEYLKIFKDACNATDIQFDDQIVSEFFDRTYRAHDLVTSGSHPAFLLSHIQAASTFLGIKPNLDSKMLDLAWQNVSSTKVRIPAG